MGINITNSLQCVSLTPTILFFECCTKAWVEVKISQQ